MGFDSSGVLTFVLRWMNGSIRMPPAAAFFFDSVQTPIECSATASPPSRATCRSAVKQRDGHFGFKTSNPLIRAASRQPDQCQVSSEFFATLKTPGAGRSGSFEARDSQAGTACGNCHDAFVLTISPGKESQWTIGALSADERSLR